MAKLFSRVDKHNTEASLWKGGELIEFSKTE
jgi:hypothetical protein